MIRGALPRIVTLSLSSGGSGIDGNSETSAANSSLTISQTAFEDSGEYVCSATNVYGQASVSATINVQGTFDESTSPLAHKIHTCIRVVKDAFESSVCKCVHKESC